MLSFSQERLLRWLCRLYSLMLLAYPSTFRREYSREMVVVFRTRARDVMQSEGSWALLPFMRHVSWDWLHTTLQEGTTMATKMPALRWFAALPLAILVASAVLKTVAFLGPHDVYYVQMYARIVVSIGCFLAAAAFVSVGVWVAPGRKDSVARIALGVVGFCGALFMASGALSMATTQLLWGTGALLGGVVAYLPWRLHAPSQALGT